jgi:hypothetical protein
MDPRTDRTLLLSLALVPLVACNLEVPDSITSGPLFTSGNDDDGGGTGDGNGDDGNGNDGNDNDGNDDDGNGDDGNGNDGNGDDGNDDGADTGIGPADDGSSTDVEPGDGGFGTEGDDEGFGTEGGGGEGGSISELCSQWGMHAQSCGGDGYAAEYCQYDLDYAQYIGGECPGAVEDFYSCLVAADCAELTDPDAPPCDDAAVAAACGTR